MCGIAGWFSPRPVDGDDDERLLRRMLAKLIHRGPDGSGILLDKHAALAHCRLAIIDLETGRQPMTVNDGNLALVYNGEIYNYRELRKELASHGIRFRTESDTEVILHTYHVHGSAGFSRLRGMFAFALWDRQQSKAMLVRDSMGIKPLFYHITDGRRLIFASEAKAILPGMEHKSALDTNSLHLLLNFRYLPGDKTMFTGIRQLPPGHILYWNSNDGHHLESFTTQQSVTVDDPLEILADSVKAHLTADVEVGAYLSGGMDSAAVVALASRYIPVRTFTLDVGDDPAETANAAKTAEILGVENHSYRTSDITLEMIRSLLWHLEVPKINAWQSCEIARHAAGAVKVVLSGLGGDELFLGYNLHGWLHRAAVAQRRIPESVSRLVSVSGLGILRLFTPPLWSEPERFLRLTGCLGDWPRVYALLRNIWDHPSLREKIYGPRMLDSKLDNAMDVLEGNWIATGDPVRDAANYEWREKMVNDLLWHEDRTSMAFGLEVRVPYLDPSLKAWTDLQSTSILMPGGARKGCMKSILRDLLPQSILNRPKSGFQVNAPVFFREHLAGLAGEYLNREKLISYGLFNPDFVEQVSRYGRSSRYRWHYFMLYFMLLTHLWIDIFERNNTPDLPLRMNRSRG